MLATLPAYGPGGQTSWPDISSIPGEPPSEATLTTSSEVVYPDAMLRSHPDSMGWNLGTSHWPRSLDGQASLWAASTAQESYPLPPASSGKLAAGDLLLTTLLRPNSRCLAAE